MAAKKADTTVRAPRRRAPARRLRATLRLVHTSSAGDGGVVELPQGVFSIGRGDCDLSLEEDARASRLHARIHVESDGARVRIVDSSANGTYVNGAPVKTAPLRDGDVVRIGDSVLVVRLVPVEAAAAPEISGLLGTA